ncbi:LysR family transcriptional regulator [Alcaligenes sp. SDU_A2]|uniref:LysR family transcriptional regulator n=1 Tax=Alcaligenes sp. SDU_A2 TaxID=3136634 RepID=UPI00311D8F26
MPSHRQLEAFYWTAKLGTLGACAEKICTTQSAVIKRIRQLEQTLGVRLFAREGRHNVLTDEGRTAMRMAEPLLQQHASLLQQFRAPNKPIQRLSIGVTEITAITWLPVLIRQLKLHYPGIILKIVIGMHAELQQMLLNNTIQLSIQQQLPPDSLLHCVDIGELRLMWVGGPEMSTTRSYYLREIASMPIIRQNHESALSQAYDDWLRPHTADSAVFTINSLIATASLVAAGQGISCLPEEYFAPMVTSGQLVRLPTRKQQPRLMYCALFRKQDRNIALYRDVTRIAQAVCRFVPAL